jgi:hypothetical protein
MHVGILVPRSLTTAAVKDHSQHTIGVEFSSRTVKLGEKRIKLQVQLTVVPATRTYPKSPPALGYGRPGTVSVCVLNNVPMYI